MGSFHPQPRETEMPASRRGSEDEHDFHAIAREDGSRRPSYAEAGAGSRRGSGAYDEEAAAEGWLELSGDFLEITDNMGTVAADSDLRITHRTAGDQAAEVNGIMVTPAPRAPRTKELQLGWAGGPPV